MMKCGNVYRSRVGIIHRDELRSILTVSNMDVENEAGLSLYRGRRLIAQNLTYGIVVANSEFVGILTNGEGET